MKNITEYPYSPALITDPKHFWNRKTAKELSQPFCADDHQALLAITQENKPVFRLVSTTVPTLPGWSSVEKACALTGLVLATKPKTIVEVGVFAGRSLFGMAVAAKSIGGCRVIGIDAYNASVSADKEIGDNATWWGALNHSSIENDCRTLLGNFQLSDVELIVKKSDDVSPPPTINLFHCDGSHTDQAVKDVERYAKNIPIGGIAVMDDLHWCQGGVLRAVDTIEEMGFRECYRLVKSENGESNDWAIFQRVK